MASSSSSPPRTPCSAFLPSSSAMPFYRRPFLDSYYAAPSYFAEKSDFTLIGEEEDSQDASYYFAPESPRSTFFVVSAERGRWKTDPMPRKFHSKPRICEPRPSSWEKELETPVSDSADTLPALDTDRDSSFGPTPSSPLPPSSPPLSPISRASSPLPLSSPLSSPVSEMLPLDEEPIQDAMAPNQKMELPERSDLNSKEILDPLPKPMLDVIVKAVLGSRENRVDETQLESGSRGVKRKLGDGKKRKEDHPGPESSRKKRRIEGGKKRANPKEVGQPSAKKAPSKNAEDPPPSAIKAEDLCPSASFTAASPAELPQDAQNGEIVGMLIESMAASRASSLPVSSLYKSVMQSRPALKAQKSDEEWLTVFLRVLESGIAGRGSGIFGKVDSSGKDDRDRPLEPRWFYVPEMDEDQERAALIKSMMPRPAKRSETKKYKQYYYRPLDKISRWDPEDSL